MPKNPARILWVNQQIHSIVSADFPSKLISLASLVESWPSLQMAAFLLPPSGAALKRPSITATPVVHRHHSPPTRRRGKHTRTVRHMYSNVDSVLRQSTRPHRWGGGESYSWEQKHPAGCWCASRLRWLDRTYFPFIGTYFKLSK